MLAKELPEEYLLICRACLPKIGTLDQVLPYTDLMEPACRKAFQTCYKDEIELAVAQSGAKR